MGFCKALLTIFLFAASVQETGASPADLVGDALLQYLRDVFLTSLADAGLSGRQGAWLGGDYIDHVPGITDAASCAKACVADADCHHWNFEVTSMRCDLKSVEGKRDPDIVSWITGDIQRPVQEPTVVP
mmetsp:Transcript_52271/g.122076  ORF Transcript_52271/g.122076 Transcript_52271/m.122076 type:complete len:129 (-) Transcript_52271:197-583(-)